MATYDPPTIKDMFAFFYSLVNSSEIWNQFLLWLGMMPGERYPSITDTTSFSQVDPLHQSFPPLPFSRDNSPALSPIHDSMSLDQPTSETIQDLSLLALDTTGMLLKTLSCFTSHISQLL